MSMKKEGMVSLWLGEAESLARLDSFLEIEFNEDGEALGSEFSRELGLKYIDEDFREAEMVDYSDSLSELLEGFSYDELIVQRFVDEIGETLGQEVNAVILLYNFEYSGDKTDIVGPGIKLHYMGAVSYR